MQNIDQNRYYEKISVQVRVDFHCCVIFKSVHRLKFVCVNKIEAMNEKPRVNIKVEGENS